MKNNTKKLKEEQPEIYNAMMRLQEVAKKKGLKTFITFEQL